MDQSFTLAYWCVLIAALLPMVCAYIAKGGGGIGRTREQGGFDNNDPRGWLLRQTGLPARANAAQANSFEGLPFFIGAVIIAHQLGAAQHWLDLLALAYVLLRALYIALYVADRATLRSLTWAAGMAVNVAILFLGYR
ncbi:MAPEG family protein [Comamonas endophytica]|uniref:MAPEG family protein n=1 Tax=Comamonas endophytica TaxID=2949090 RepID=A0ABY6GCX4_9BURK|nr:MULTISPECIES: MAPEG family protein [unclassified Acidovorax]MCD2513850.1 MAPEG family protein [Acidovorax sp. D4N7]UYG52150.1 MAPEG family protein [Acidovorax sp. 5MLIR]